MTVVASSSGILVRVRRTGESIKEHRLYRIENVCVAVEISNQSGLSLSNQSALKRR